MILTRIYWCPRDRGINWHFGCILTLFFARVGSFGSVYCTLDNTECDSGVAWHNSTSVSDGIRQYEAEFAAVVL